MAKPGAAFWRITPCFGQLAAKQTGAYILAKSCFSIAAGKAGYTANDLATNVSTVRSRREPRQQARGAGHLGGVRAPG